MTNWWQFGISEALLSNVFAPGLMDGAGMRCPPPRHPALGSVPLGPFWGEESSRALPADRGLFALGRFALFLVENVGSTWVMANIICSPLINDTADGTKSGGELEVLRAAQIW